MWTGWRYRIAGVGGVAALSALAVFVANLLPLQRLFTTYVPLFWRLDPVILTGQDLVFAMVLTAVFVGACSIPLYKPRPWRMLDIIAFAQKRVIVAGFGLATLGYFRWSYRLPRATLTMTAGILFVAVPLWFLWIRQPPRSGTGRTIIVGDDMEQIERIVEESDTPFFGYLCPSAVIGTKRAEPQKIISDGGMAIGTVNRLGGLSRLEDVLVEYDIETVVLAFTHADRSEFFGTLDACYEHGVAAQVHREYADSVLTSDDSIGTLVDVDIEPWDVQDHVFKRGFDIAFAGLALLAVSPIVALIVLAIKIEGEGPILFSQERTYLFGETFTVHKFRTLKPVDEDVDLDIDENRQTPLGNFLRTTHLDEIPQLWSILNGDMSVVGPRPAITELEPDYERQLTKWRQRWFVKPGLTGLAQINDATGKEPEKKLRYDMEYIRNQSFWFDLRILFRQLWKVFEDVLSLVTRS